MKPAELRIGNLVEYNRNVVECVDVMCDGINTKYIEGINIGFIQPIPLTEEWLVKFGFEEEKDNDGVFGFKLKNFWYINEYQFRLSNFIDTESMVIDNKIHHIHQLQNLYFALTGEELTIKNK
jgi:hypothetical protein